ncbi:MAG: hypothetical protein UX81_C0035G0005 [Parcubacteria group bacterium GW2011_GWA2_47_12]|nr:MAG: hypothetical protein UX81_C0035G0005 [Parcubacteria group bacterium GW2011_GWA2_47_12]
MRLLFITQAIDERDPVLGFVCGWLRAFSGEFTRISSVCLRKGEFNAPENVSVFSISHTAPDAFFRRTKYTFRFLRYIWRKRYEYDAVFVHMNPEYVLLGWFLWKIQGKRVVLWYNHQAGGIRIRLAALFADVLFHTSPFAYTARYRKAARMPAGIDTALFHKTGKMTQKNSMVFVGRIAPIKKLEVLLNAVLQLHREGFDFFLSVCGESAPRDKTYAEKIRKLGAPLEATGKLRFCGAVRHTELPDVFSAHEIAINISPAGLFDKTVLEAAACECTPLISSPAFKNFLPDALFFKEGDSVDLSRKIKILLSLPTEEKEALGETLRQKAVRKHGLSILAHSLPSFFVHD